MSVYQVLQRAKWTAHAAQTSLVPMLTRLCHVTLWHSSLASRLAKARKVISSFAAQLCNAGQTVAHRATEQRHGVCHRLGATFHVQWSMGAGRCSGRSIGADTAADALEAL